MDNLYLTGVYSTDSATTSAFVIYIYIPEATPSDITSIITMQLIEMQKMGILNPADNFTDNMTTHSLLDTHHTTYLDDEKISHTKSNAIPIPRRHTARLHRYDTDIFIGHVRSNPTG
jgi:hypothetical protein